MDEQVKTVELLVNEIGAFDGSKAVGLDADGLYFLEVEADGEWPVSVE